jgi:single-strand DNA-binding protein
VPTRFLVLDNRSAGPDRAEEVESTVNDTLITLQGRLGSNVTTRQVGDTVVASFRLASNPRRLNRRTGEWSDGETQWYTVTAWRALAENCERSLRRGDPVVVHGRFRISPWTNADGVSMTSLEIEAGFVGHDLNRGATLFTRTPRQPAEPPTDGPGAEAPDFAGAPADAVAPDPAREPVAAA